MKIIDLTKEIASGMAVYPGDPAVKIEEIQTIESEGWRLSKMEMGTHTGTHVDAFSHMLADGETLDEMPLSRFCGPARYVSHQDEFPSGMGLIFKEAVDSEDFKKIIEAEPNFVAGELSVDLEKSLLEAGMVTYTDLVNLDKLPIGETFTFYGLPLKIKGGDGSPVRAVAIVN